MPEGEGEIEITLSWKNETQFSMTRKKNDEPPKIIVKLEEQGHISHIWPYIEKIVIEQITIDAQEIGMDMKKKAT